MADRRRLVTISPTGTVTVVSDLQVAGVSEGIRDAFTVVPPPSQQVVAQRQRRYGGGRVVAETHQNGAVRDALLISGTTVDIALGRAEALIAVTQAPRTDLFYEYRAESATASVYYEITGPAKYGLALNWAQLQGSGTIPVDLEFPVAPLARLDAYDVAIASTTLPAFINSTINAIPGDAPALADITLRTSGGASAPIWALMGWCKRPTVSPIASSVSPVGIIEAETGTSLSTWAVTADAAYRGGSGIRVNTSGAGTASASYAVDPSIVPADDFSSDVDIEVWAAIEVAAGVVTPRLTLSLEPNAGTTFGQATFSPDFGSAGRLITKPATTTHHRFTRLGVLTMPVDTFTPLRWNIRVQGSWGVGSNGLFGLDYLLCVPVRARACSKTGVANDTSYGKFIASTSDTRKTIRHDLSGRVGSAALNQGRDSGLGGSLIELPPGDVDLVIKLASMVPDDPTIQDLSEQLSHTGVTGNVRITPRVQIVKGT